MCSLPVFAGLDYHDEQVQVCVLDQQGKVKLNRRFANDARRIHEAVAREGVVSRAAIEACCGAANLAEELISRFAWPIDLAHPGYVARLKQSPDKTDLGDARLVADLARVGYIPKVWLAPKYIRQLRALTRYRQQLVRERRDAKLRVRALLRENRQRPPEGVNAWTKAWLRWIDELPCPPEDRWLLEQHLLQIKQLGERITIAEKRLAQVTADDPVVRRLLEEQGVGLVTAATLRAEIGRFDRFRNGKQLARFCGVTPRNASSGQRQADAGLIQAGNPELRRVLIELAHRLVWRCKGRWWKLACELMQRGKPRNVVVAAVANRWVRALHHEMLPIGAT
jgi:transposase